MSQNTADDVKKKVRRHYAKVAKSSTGNCSGNAGEGCCFTAGLPSDSISRTLGYSETDLSSVVDGANMNLGCGNPVAISRLRPGESVLDLGCGGGFDAFLAAKAVGEKGQVIGVDMTADMIEKARKNTLKMGVENVSFRLGEIEYLPVANSSVDVILSNCVVNLSPDKPGIWREAYRVLRPGGRLAISDIVATGRIPKRLMEKAAMLTGCVAGAEQVEVLQAQLEEAGFEKITIRIRPESGEWIRHWFPESLAEQFVASADIEAVKPVFPELRIPEGDDWIQLVRQKAQNNFSRFGNCTQSIVAAFMEVLELDTSGMLRASSGFLGGMMSSLTCGIHSAGVIVLGLIAGRERMEDGLDGMLPLVRPTQKLVRRLNTRFGSHSCGELTGVDFTNLREAMKFQASGAHDPCIERVADGAEEIARLISENSQADQLFRPNIKRRA